MAVSLFASAATWVVPMASFVGVSAFVGAWTLWLRESRDKNLDERLRHWTTDARRGAAERGRAEREVASSIAKPTEASPGVLVETLTRWLNLSLFLQQADWKIRPARFLAASAGMLLLGASSAAVPVMPLVLVPILALALALVPLAYAAMRRSRRKKQFAAQLPEAMELMARALRAGHSLASGFHLVASEMAEPIAGEFLRCYEEQNLGLPMEEALDGLAARVPNPDLRFFATAVILQRSTGGDLAEILDKIGYLVRERFKIRGQVQALTGEGRLSGSVLLALPPLLFVVMLRLNYAYVMKLFEDPLGQQMVATAIVLQVLGALVIRKIVNIRV